MSRKAKRRKHTVLSGNKCAVEGHDHMPHECPGRARIKCEVCGKPTIEHDSFGFCKGVKK